MRPRGRRRRGRHWSPSPRWRTIHGRPAPRRRSDRGHIASTNESTAPVRAARSVAAVPESPPAAAERGRKGLAAGPESAARRWRASGAGPGRGLGRAETDGCRLRPGQRKLCLDRRWRALLGAPPRRVGQRSIYWVGTLCDHRERIGQRSIHNCRRGLRKLGSLWRLSTCCGPHALCSLHSLWDIQVPSNVAGLRVRARGAAHWRHSSGSRRRDCVSDTDCLIQPRIRALSGNGIILRLLHLSSPVAGCFERRLVANCGRAGHIRRCPILARFRAAAWSILGDHNIGGLLIERIRWRILCARIGLGRLNISKLLGHSLVLLAHRGALFLHGLPGSAWHFRACRARS